MKNCSFILVFMLFLGSAPLLAQDGAFAKGQKDINIGVGFGGAYGIPIGGSFDYGITDKISIGAYVGYAGKTEEIGGYGVSYKWKYTAFLMGLRGAYHFPLGESFDAYAGAMLGYNYGSVELDGAGSSLAIAPSYGGLAYSAFLGGRYRFTKSIGVFAELGYGISYLQTGLNFRF